MTVFLKKQAAEERAPHRAGTWGTFPIRREERRGISALKCRIQRQAAPEKAANRAIRMKGFAGRARAGSFGEEEKRGLPLSGASSPAPLRTVKAHLPSRAKQRWQGLYPLLRASTADLTRTVQALQLK